MSLQQEITDLLAGYNTPLSVARKVALAVRKVERDRIAPGIEVGETAPEIELVNHQGKPVSLSRLLGDGPVIVTFFRGAWCPVCNLQVAALARALPRIRALGGTIIGVHPDAEPMTAEPIEGFELCSDPGQEVIRRWKVQFEIEPELQKHFIGEIDSDISRYNLDGKWRLPVPATFLVDQAGVVRRRHVTADFTKRMEPDEIIAALEALMTK